MVLELAGLNYWRQYEKTQDLQKHCYLWVKDYEKEILYRCSSCGLQQVERKEINIIREQEKEDFYNIKSKNGNKDKN